MENEQGFSHVDWSASTAALYASCPRRFYYRCANENDGSTNGATSGSAVPHPGAKIGSVVHDCIEEQVLRWRDGEPLTLQAAQKSATEQLQAYIDDNKEIIEAQYWSDDNEEFNATEFARSLIRTAHQHLECFFQVIWPQLDDHQYILHEKTASFEVDGQTVWVRPDLCTRSQDGEFVVTDWKTSPADRFSDPGLQVLTYALWAYEEYEPDLDRILVQLVHTRQGEFDRMRPKPDDISRIQERILSDCETWRDAENVTDFKPKPEVGKCRSCPYLQKCSAGKDIVGDISM